MAYPGVALIAMVGIGLGFALWYFLADDSHHPQNPHHFDPPPPRSSSPVNNSWDSSRNTRRRCEKTNATAIDDCSICRFPMRGVTTKTRCGHSFHAKCIDQWRAVQAGQAVCPLCRQYI